jgi:hypothetical protein
MGDEGIVEARQHVKINDRHEDHADDTKAQQHARTESITMVRVPQPPMQTETRKVILTNQSPKIPHRSCPFYSLRFFTVYRRQNQSRLDQAKDTNFIDKT